MTRFVVGKCDDLEPGQYRRLEIVGKKRVKIVAEVCCPKCGGAFVLAKHYQIGAGGLLNPVLRCPLAGCGWFKAATLEGWK
jgi:ribosomal protein S27AE